jgi:predicted membrane-bound dolichyl-phosphate-mannose-protein mannosyltransferase
VTHPNTAAVAAAAVAAVAAVAAAAVAAVAAVAALAALADAIIDRCLRICHVVAVTSVGHFLQYYTIIGKMGLTQLYIVEKITNHQRLKISNDERPSPRFWKIDFPRTYRQFHQVGSGV